LKRIKNHWLGKSPVALNNLGSFKYLAIDATYFHKNGCLVSLMHTPDQLIVSNFYVRKESSLSTLHHLSILKQEGLDSFAITTDGEQSVLRSITSLWPNIIKQRCLYHIQHEGCRWLRSYPPYSAGKHLRLLLLRLTHIHSVKQQARFLTDYKIWLKFYKPSVLALPMNIKVNYDLKRTMTLIDNALPHMFHYLMDPLIHSTTNALEGWHSRIKRSYRQHSGLTQHHKIQFLKWHAHFENQQKINNL